MPNSGGDFFSELAASFTETTDTYAHDLRLDIASLIGRGLDEKEWTQKDLSDETGVSEAIISRMINAGQNCTIESVAKVLFALGIRAKITDEPDIVVRLEPDWASEQQAGFPFFTHGPTGLNYATISQKGTIQEGVAGFFGGFERTVGTGADRWPSADTRWTQRNFAEAG